MATPKAGENPPPPTPEDEQKVKDRFKGWVNEVLDERAAKAEEDRKKAEEEAEKEAAQRRTREPMSLLRQFLGA